MQSGEPPYYPKMREHGYPPGYLKCLDETGKLLSQNKLYGSNLIYFISEL